MLSGPNPVHLWAEDARFRALWGRIAERTIVDHVRCFMLYQFCQQTETVPGDLAEVGVYRGGTARLLGEARKGHSKVLHLFDTFAGMPATDPDRDHHVSGDFDGTSLEAVREYLSGLPDVVMYPGVFPATASPLQQRRFSLVHVDADIHRSVLDCCDFFYPRLNPGGVLVFDDYGFISCRGARMAVDSFFADKPEHPCYLPTGQCVVTRV